MEFNSRATKTNLDSNSKINLNEQIRSLLEQAGIPEEDISLLSSTGIHIMGLNTIYDDVSVSINNIKRESSLLYCRFNSSLYNQLVQVVTDVSLARPSKIDLFTRIPLYQIEQKGKLVQAETWEYEYKNTERVAVIDDKDFITVIPSFFIRYSKNPKIDDVRVFYKNSDGTTQNVISYTSYIDGFKTVSFKATFQQITVENKQFTFDDSQLARFIVSTTNPIHDFNIYYSEAQGEPEELINKRLFYTRDIGNFLEYKILANNKIAIEHKYMRGGFAPTVMGRLRVELLTTTGENVKYSAYAKSKSLIKDDLKVSYIPTTDIFESIGGSLASEDKEYLRNYIIKLKGSRGKIDTEADMGTFLLPYEGSSIFQPRLVRNDIERVFHIYTVLSFNEMIGLNKREFTIPTDSGNVMCNLGDLPVGNVNGDNWYCVNSSMAIKSIQDNIGSSYDLDLTTDINTPAGNDSDEYYYVSPFIYSYRDTDSFCRSFMDSQYDVPYTTVVTYDNPLLTPTRFVNATIRVNDYEIDNTHKRIFSLKSMIRADNESFKPEVGTNFRAELEMVDIGNNKFTVPITNIEDLMKDNTYNLVFNLKSDRHIFNLQTTLDFLDNTDSVILTKTVPVKQNVVLKLYATDTTVSPTEMLVSTHETTLEIFKEVTDSLYLQNNIPYSGRVEFVLLPLVSMNFYAQYANKRKITEEILNVFNFIKTEVYMELEEYSEDGLSLRNRQETLFDISIKFAKTYGRSKFLNVGNVTTSPIVNLQLKPKLFIRKLDNEFDESSISSELNSNLIQHDYDMSDLHMSTLVADVMTNATDSVSILQFVNFDTYPSDFHLIRRNDVEMKNYDVPEVVSIEPIRNDTLDIYEHNIEFINI